MDALNTQTQLRYGEYLRKLREVSGLSQTQLCAKIWADDPAAPKEQSQLSNLWNWESGRTVPRQSMRMKIAKAFGVSEHSIHPAHFKRFAKRQLLLAGGDTDVAQAAVENSEYVATEVPVITEVEEELLPQPGEEYGDYLRRVRKFRGLLTLIQAGEAYWPGNGKNAATSIGQWERSVSTPSYDNANELAKVYGVPVSLIDPQQFARLQKDREAQETYGDYLARLRVAAGFKSVRELAAAMFGAERAKNQASTIGRWERDLAMPAPKSLKHLAQVLKVSVLTVDPHRYQPGRLLPPTLKRPEPEPKPAAPEPEIESEKISNSDDAQWMESSRIAEEEQMNAVPSIRQEYGQVPQFLKQHVDVFGVSKTDDPNYVRIRFDAILPRKTAGSLMRELVILTTDDLLSNGEE